MLLLILTAILSACDQQHPDLSFYYWKTTWNDAGAISDYVAQSDGPIFLRFFDIDRPDGIEEPQFRGPIVAQSPLPNRFVPTVFITNRTFVDPDSLQAIRLPRMVYDGLVQRGWNGQGEVQFDCDWTLETRPHFFQFLQDFQAMAGDSVSLSATIRLHQVKFAAKTGIPPVGHGTLMFYNMGQLRDLNTENSILDLEVAESYLKNLPQYPLKLDIALPIFGWAVVHRWGKVVNLLPEVTPEDLKADSLLEMVDDRRAKVRKSHYFCGVYVYEGDDLRLEYTTPENLNAAARLVTRYAPAQGFRYVLFYHLSEITAQKFPIDELETTRDLLP